MCNISFAKTCALVLLSVTALVGAQPRAQQLRSSSDSKSSTPTRTRDSHPDLQGTYSFATGTPLERPAELAGKQTFTEEEAAAYERQAAGNRAQADSAPARPGEVRAYNNFWLEPGTKVVKDRRTSLIVDPPDGRLPPMTPEGQTRADAHRARLGRPPEGPEDRDASERCLLGFNAGPPMVPAGYNQNVQIVQTRDYVVIHTEMVHTARVVPLDGRPHPPKSIRFWSGDSRGHWEGHTLVVDTTNFNDQSWNQFNRWNWAADENLHVVERFTLTDPDTVRYEFTVSDPTTWTRPWTAVLPLQRISERIYEYACHEGNQGMTGMLRGARAVERQPAEVKK